MLNAVLFSVPQTYDVKIKLPARAKGYYSQTLTKTRFPVADTLALCLETKRIESAFGLCERAQDFFENPEIFEEKGPIDLFIIDAKAMRPEPIFYGLRSQRTKNGRFAQTPLLILTEKPKMLFENRAFVKQAIVSTRMALGGEATALLAPKDTQTFLNAVLSLLPLETLARKKEVGAALEGVPYAHPARLDEKGHLIDVHAFALI